jgi:hypothetical protein
MHLMAFLDVSSEERRMQLTQRELLTRTSSIGSKTQA